MKTDEMVHRQPLQSEDISEASMTIERQSEARRSAQHYPRQTDLSGNRKLTQEERWAYGLGWFGIGLSLTELLVPQRMARMIGAPHGHEGLIRTMGLREIASGIGILTQRQPATATWLRVAGDALDLALLGAAFTSSQSQRGRLAAATVSVAWATMMDLITAQQLSRGIKTKDGIIPIPTTLIIDREPEELYRYWRKLTTLPQFMKHLVRIDVKDARRSHWVAQGPAETTVEWDAEIIEDRSNEYISWRSVDVMEVELAGSIRFEHGTGDRGTVVTVDMHYRPPFGMVGAAIAAWLGKDPSQTVKIDLRRFKQLMEVGDVITTEGQSTGR